MFIVSFCIFPTRNQNKWQQNDKEMTKKWQQHDNRMKNKLECQKMSTKWQPFLFLIFQCLQAQHFPKYSVIQWILYDTNVIQHANPYHTITILYGVYILYIYIYIHIHRILYTIQHTFYTIHHIIYYTQDTIYYTLFTTYTIYTIYDILWYDIIRYDMDMI